MIKSKIIYKKSRGDQLSKSEQKYLAAWVKQISKGKSTNLTNLRDVMVPKHAS